MECWGADNFDQAGVTTPLGAPPIVRAPALVTVPAGIASVVFDTSAQQACTLQVGGALWCWGLHLGPLPTQVAGFGA
jgi:hypothetical protein